MYKIRIRDLCVLGLTIAAVEGFKNTNLYKSMNIDSEPNRTEIPAKAADTATINSLKLKPDTVPFYTDTVKVKNSSLYKPSTKVVENLYKTLSKVK